MHYVRFLKPPRFLQWLPPLLSAKITVTTDLGEYFLAQDVVLVVELEDEHGTRLEPYQEKFSEHIWKGSQGMRSLEVSVLIPYKYLGGSLKMLIRPKESNYSTDLLSCFGHSPHVGSDGGIVAIRSMLTATTNTPSEIVRANLAERVFHSDTGVETRIWEETGESIAKHIWDAGVILSSYLSACCSEQPPTKPTRLPALSKILRKDNLEVLELGAGCGIVGITLAQCFPTSRVLLTDLDAATDILTHNIFITSPTVKDRIAHQVLDWEQPLPANIASKTWDLIAVADCTYNPDVVPYLVSTLHTLAEKSPDVYILLAMKVRHDSEMVFFQLMETAGFIVEEKMSIPLPVLGAEEEAIDVYGFTLVMLDE